METIASQLQVLFSQAIKDAFGLDADPLIGLSQNEKFGDYQSNAAMGLAKQVEGKTGQKTNPRQVAEGIKAKLQLGEMASEVSIAGPGFINVRLNPAWLARRLASLAANPKAGCGTLEHPQTIVVDYSAPNVAKEMHVGHLRTTVIGDTFARTFDFLGHRVIRQNHIGDWGTQFGRVMLGLWYDAVAWHLKEETKLENWIARALPIVKGPDDEPKETQAKRLADQAALLGELVPWHQKAIDLDPDGTKIFEPYIRERFPNLKRLDALYTFASAVTAFADAKNRIIRHPKHGEKSLKELASFFATFVQKQQLDVNKQEGEAWAKSVSSTLDTCQAIYRQLNVLLTREDVRGESAYNGALPGVVEDLLKTGIAELSEGAAVVFVEGFDAPLIIRKSDGGFGYATTDLAAVRYRVGTLHADRVIYVVGLPQSQHFAQIFATAKRSGWAGSTRFEHAGFGSVLGSDGKLLRTRSGGTVKLKELLDEGEERGYQIAVLKDGERVAKAKERGESDASQLSEPELRRIGHAIGIGAVKYADLSKDRMTDYVFDWDKMLAFEGNTAPYLQYVYARIQSIFRKAAGSTGDGSIKLEAPQEIALAKQILRLGEVIEQVAKDLKPHLLCQYLYDLATKFSGFYENCPVLSSEEPTRSSRLALCKLTADTMAQGLDLLGIEHPDQM